MEYMKKAALLMLVYVLFALTACGGSIANNEAAGAAVIDEDELSLTYILPPPNTDGDLSIESALENRRSQRNFRDKPLSVDQLSQILWAAYGITSPRPDNPSLRGGLRTAPSAGALYPLEVYAIVGNVDGIEPGAYKYLSEEHKIIMVASGDVRDSLADAVFRQSMVTEAPAAIFYSAVFSRTTERYGEQGRHFVYIELGHSAQNVYLQAEALQLGTCAIGTVTEAAREILNLPEEEDPLYLMPIGYYQ